MRNMCGFSLHEVRRSSAHLSRTLGEQGWPVARSLFVTDDGCPISARFWQMWDSTALHRARSTATGLDVVGHLQLAHSGAEVRGIPHLPKPGRYGAPVISYGPGRVAASPTLRYFCW